MPQPEITFSSPEEQLKYSIKILVEAGFTPHQIETIRNKAGLGNGRIPYSKELTGQRRYMVQELLAANLSNRQISEVLQLSKQTVHADRDYNRQLWTSEILRSQDTWRAQLIKEQHELKERALEAFEQSKVRRVVTSRQGSDESTIRTEESAGESSFLSVARSCLEQQAKLIGLYDIKPQVEEKSGYKGFLDTLSKEVRKIAEAEKNAGDRAGAIETKAEFNDDGEPDGNSRPMLPADASEPL